MCLAVPGKIIEIIGDDPLLKMAKVSFNNVNKMIDISLVPEAKINDYVLVHVGFALSIIDEEEAKKTLDYLSQMGDIN